MSRLLVSLNWKAGVEILILWFVYYRIMLFFQGSRALQVLRGIVILVFAFFLFQILHLETLDWLLTHVFGISVIGILVIFQPEIRQGLARLGQQHLFKTDLREEEIDAMIREIIEAADALSKARTGAVIAIERMDSLRVYAESGVIIDSKVTAELLETIFTPNSLLHDGGVVLRQDRIIAAGCLFPLTDKPDLSRILGTRHRAAIGLTEQTDAVVVTVSEETGAVSFCHNGRLTRDIDSGGLLKILKDNIRPKRKYRSTPV